MSGIPQKAGVCMTPPHILDKKPGEGGWYGVGGALENIGWGGGGYAMAGWEVATPHGTGGGVSPLPHRT